MPKWARILIWCGVVVGAGVVYVWFFGPQTMLTLFARYKFRGIPVAGMTPVALANVSISTVAHRKFSYSGYEFELPWDDVDEQKDRNAGPIHVSAFKSGNTFWFSTFPPRSFVDGMIKETKLDPEAFRQVYGDEAYRSDYGFYLEMLSATPGTISPFESRRDAARGFALLLIKAIAMPSTDSGIFLIQTGDFKGFQFGAAQGRPPRITDELYADDGGIDIMFSQKPGGTAPSISQPEINRVIQSIRKIPKVPATADH